jgi:hypothetical protein
MYEAVVVGVLIGGIALWSALSPAAPAYFDYMLALLGAWSIAAPFVFGYHTTVEVARNSDIAIGIAVVLIALFGHFYASPVTRHKAAA